MKRRKMKKRMKRKKRRKMKKRMKRKKRRKERRKKPLQTHLTKSYIHNFFPNHQTTPSFTKAPEPQNPSSKPFQTFPLKLLNPHKPPSPSPPPPPPSW